MTDETIHNRRRTDGQISQWITVGVAALVALGGTTAFTFSVYESVRDDLVVLGRLQPTLDAHITADRELQRLCQSRMDYLEKRLDQLLAECAHCGSLLNRRHSASP